MEPSFQLIGARSIALRLWITFLVAVCAGCAGDGPTGGPAGAGGGGTGGSGGSALATPELTVESGGIKTLRFSWGAVEGATSYRLEYAPEGPPSFVQAGGELDPSVTQIAVEVPVHLIDWAEARYRVAACDQLGCSNSEPVGISEHMLEVIGYFKASNAWAGDWFGEVALSADGKTMAVGAQLEDSGATTVNGDQEDDSKRWAGAVYVFSETDGVWSQEAYLKASNSGVEDRFGSRLAISADGNTIITGARFEDSNGDPDDDSLRDSGAAYVFRRTDGTWAEEAYLKALSPEEGASFREVAVSADGNRVAVGGPRGAGTNGMVEIFDRVAEGGGSFGWARGPLLSPGRTRPGDVFGRSLSFAGDGETLVVGAPGDDSTGIELDNDAPEAGAAYVFSYDGADWTASAYIKASLVGSGDGFGVKVVLSGDGKTLAIGARGEAGGGTGVGADPTDDSAERSGAVYLFARDGDDWLQEAYVKASNTDPGDGFGDTIGLTDDGSVMVCGARAEASAALGVGGNAADNSLPESGAAYVYVRNDAEWRFTHYLKAPNAGEGDLFGMAVALSGDGSRLAVGASYEDSDSTGIGGDQGDAGGDVTQFGAVYLY